MVRSYLDASLVVSIVARDDHSDRADRWLDTLPDVAFSLWTLAEASSALSHAVRTGRLTVGDRRRSETEMDRRFDPAMPSTDVRAADFLAARALLSMFPLLRAPDAVHLAIAEREGWRLATFDHRLADAARTLGLELALP